VVSAAGSPVLLIGGWTIAAMLQLPSFNPVTDTISALAALGATDRWLMTLVFMVAGVCDVITGLALRPAAPAGRLILIAGAVAGMLVAAYPEHAGSGSVPHALWASLGFAGLPAWPTWARRRGPSVPRALRRKRPGRWSWCCPAALPLRQPSHCRAGPHAVPGQPDMSISPD
jgi:hypothetical protein